MRTGAPPTTAGASPRPSPDGAPASRPHGTLPARAGLGLKPQHFREVLACRPAVGFFEVHAENYLVEGGVLHAWLTRIRAEHPLSIHGVGLSIGGEGPLNRDHLRAIRALVDRYEPAEFSEHLAWSSHGAAYLNDLLPVPYDRESLERICDHVDAVQTALGRRMLLENPSTYVEYAASTMDDAQFLGAVVNRTGCGLLVDVNNALVSAVNRGGDAWSMLTALPVHAIGEIHLAGYAEQIDGAGAPLLIDDHGCAVRDPVWRLYERFTSFAGCHPTLIEWDNDVPSFERLCQEAGRADDMLLRSSGSTIEARK